MRRDGIAKDAPIVTYCSVGYRSGKMAERLQAAGYTNVRNLEGSIFKWANEHRPLVRGESEPVAGASLQRDLGSPARARGAFWSLTPRARNRSRELEDEDEKERKFMPNDGC